MPNLVVDDNGRGTLEYELKGATFAGLMDVAGSAMVVHAYADDQQTDPSGNSGDSMACGLFKTGYEPRGGPKWLGERDEERRVWCECLGNCTLRWSPV